MALLDLLLWAFAVAIYTAIHVLLERRRNGRGAPTCWPVVGMLPTMLRNKHRIYDWITDLVNASATATYVFKGPIWSCMHTVVSAHPPNIEHVLRTNFENYPKGSDFHLVFRDLLGNGVFNSDGAAWRLQRKSAALHFASKPFRRFVDSAVADTIENRLIPLLEAAAETGKTVDLQDIFLRFTFENTCKLIFGQDVPCLVKGLPRVEFAVAFDDAVETTLVRHFMPIFCWRILSFFGLFTEHRMRRSLGVVSNFVNQLLNGAERQGDGDPHLLGSFWDQFSVSREALQDAVMNFMIAGRDTSGAALTWLFWLLLRHPAALARATAEVDDAKELVYLRAAVNEALRLFPPVSLDHKGVLRDDVLPDGTVIRKGMRFVYSIYSMGRLPALWGPDCLLFRPERWLDGSVVSPSLFKFPVFNAGPRLCLGRDMAYNQMLRAASAILGRFEVQLQPPDYVPEQRVSLVLTMKHGLPVTIRSR